MPQTKSGGKPKVLPAYNLSEAQDKLGSIVSQGDRGVHSILKRNRAPAGVYVPLRDYEEAFGPVEAA